jgi:hypothetical protein
VKEKDSGGEKLMGIGKRKGRRERNGRGRER